jgi:hypothetical protein
MSLCMDTFFAEKRRQLTIHAAVINPNERKKVEFGKLDCNQFASMTMKLGHFINPVSCPSTALVWPFTFHIPGFDYDTKKNDPCKLFIIFSF